MFSGLSSWTYFKLYVPYSNALQKNMYGKHFSFKKVDGNRRCHSSQFDEKDYTAKGLSYSQLPFGNSICPEKMIEPINLPICIKQVHFSHPYQ